MVGDHTRSPGEGGATWKNLGKTFGDNVEKTVEKNINQSSGEADSKKDIDDALDQFGDFYIGPRSAPSYSQIFEKTCK